LDLRVSQHDHIARTGPHGDIDRNARIKPDLLPGKPSYDAPIRYDWLRRAVVADRDFVIEMAVDAPVSRQRDIQLPLAAPVRHADRDQAALAVQSTPAVCFQLDATLSQL